MPGMLDDFHRQRFSEGTKFLPVAFVFSIIVGLWFIFTFYHCIPRMGSSTLSEHIGRSTQNVFELVIFNCSTLLMLICYFACIFVHPGTIPDKEEDQSWEYVNTGHDSARGSSVTGALLAGSGLGGGMQEFKRSGDRRSCKWCSKYKPDRCHHCRVCRMCILKMDHHCPWIYNCVGFRNHKYFFLLLLYSTVSCHIIFWTMRESLNDVIDNDDAPFMSMFLLLFGETLTGFVGLLVTLFFMFHIWLMMKAMTTIEFCEKSMKSTSRINYDASVYDRGTLGNIYAVLGDQPLLWLLPCSLPSGKGLSFVSEKSPLYAVDSEIGQRWAQEYSLRESTGVQVVDGKHGVLGGGSGDDGRGGSRTRRGQPASGAGTGEAPQSANGSDEETSDSELGPEEQVRKGQPALRTANSSGAADQTAPPPKFGQPEARAAASAIDPALSPPQSEAFAAASSAYPLGAPAQPQPTSAAPRLQPAAAAAAAIDRALPSTRDDEADSSGSDDIDFDIYSPVRPKQSAETGARAEEAGAKAEAEAP